MKETSAGYSVSENLMNLQNQTDDDDSTDFMSLAKSFLTYKIGDGINKSYFPILVPVGIVGNLLSFLVMRQKHNRHISISLYISALSVTDSIALLIGLATYLNSIHRIDFPPNQHWFCAIATAVLWAAGLSSTLFILNMTFDRFYCIIRPHKAASFNTVKRAKITIASVTFTSILFNIPYLYAVTNVGRNCLADQTETWKTFYHWLNYVIQFAIPFVSLLSMNSVIIHTLRRRSMFINKPQLKSNEGQDQGQNSNMKKSEKQTYAILLLVAFSFFILITPLYICFLYMAFVDFTKTSKSYAEFYLFYNIAHKMFYTNNGINFFLYVLSGRKFRNEVLQLFKCKNNGNVNSKNNTTPKLQNFLQLKKNFNRQSFKDPNLG